MPNNLPDNQIGSANSKEAIFIKKNFEIIIIAFIVILTSISFFVCYRLLHLALTAPERFSIIFYCTILFGIFCQFIVSIISHYTDNLTWDVKLRRFRKALISFIGIKYTNSKKVLFITILVVILSNLVAYKMLNIDTDRSFRVVSSNFIP